MWVGGLEIPSELVDAHRAGRLVLFVGSGASKDAPANLPDFGGLTQSIADQARHPVSEADLLHPDIVLGRMKDGGVDVHLRVADHLSDPASTHNRLHEAIIDLALAGPDIRIVTTNFDRHLTSAIDARGAEVEEFVAPALPVGNDFTGVVYLHGTLRQPPNRLVVTDDDFGIAYLRDAWAARFLERMFAEFAVLFIGYSHGDVVMRYLARALGPDGRRYVLTSTPDDQDWTDLGLRPIRYEVDGSSHAALGGAVARWTEIAGMGLLDHRRRVAELVAVPPSGIPEDESYLEDLIADGERVGLFTEFARGPEWLDWVAFKPVFKKLFSRGTQSAATDKALAQWFAEFFVGDEAHTEKALSLVGANGGYLGPDVCYSIGRRVNVLRALRPAWLGVWLVLLVRDAPASDTFWLDQAMMSSTWPNDREQVMLLFDHLTEPTPGLTTSYGLGPPHLGIHLRGSDHALREAWTKILQPNLQEAAHALLSMTDRHLRRISDLQVGAQPGNPDWDAVSFGRSAIEPHSQDNYTEPVDVLIDVARDGIEVLLNASDPIAAGYLHTWADADSQLLHRLAVHGWAHRSDVDDSAKIQWVVAKGWVTDHRVRHEVFRLIAAAIPGASDEAIGTLVANVRGRGDDEPDYRDYERFNTFAWMDEHRPGHPAIVAALAEAHAVDPSWEVRNDPDLTHSMQVGFIPSRPPMAVEDLRTQLAQDPAALLFSLQEYKGVGPFEGKPTWEDVLALIISAVKAEPADGFTLLDIEPPDSDVTQAVIEGWSRVVADADTVEAILDRIAYLDRAPLARDLAAMLSHGATVEGHPTDWSSFPKARSLALDLWDLIPDEDVGLGEIDWISRAINHPGGNLAEFWLNAIQHDWRTNEAAWSGLTEEHRHALGSMLSGPSTQARTHMAEVICVSRLHFLFAADPAWTTQTIIPLLDWSDPSRAQRCWSAFTRWGRWNDRILDAGLMEHYLQTANHLDEFDPDHSRRVLGHLAGITLTSQRDPFEWLPDIIVDLSEGNRTALADAVAEILNDLPSEAVEHEWARWMHTYWTGRLRSIPIQLSFDECTAMAGWVPFLTDSFEVGVDLVFKRSARLREHDNGLRHLEQRVNASPRACAQMIGHLMRSTQLPWWGEHDLRRLMPQLRSGGSQSDLDVIAEQAIRLGLGDPNTW